MGAVVHQSFNKYSIKLARMLTLLCISALVAVTVGQHVPPPPHPSYPPRPPPGYPHPSMRHYGRPPIGGKGPLGGFDPLTFLLFQNGGLGGSGGGDLQSILPLLLLGGGGLGGHPGKGGLGGGMNPLLLSSLLGGCKEPVDDCTPPNKADGTLCGVNGLPTHKRCCECTKP